MVVSFGFEPKTLASAS